MRKAFAAGMAALTFGGAVATAALPSAAEAQPYGYYGGYGGHHHHNNDAAAAAIVAGVAGLAIGAALSNHHGYYNNGYYGSGYGYAPSYSGGYGYAPSYYGGYAPSYYGSGYGYTPGYYGGGYGYATCASRRWVWDPYIGRRVLVTSHYAC